MQPLAAVCTRNDALCTQYGAERNIAERGKSRVKLCLGVLVSRFLTPGGEYLVSIVIVVVTAAAVTVVLVVMIVVMLMLMVMIVAAAGAVLVVLVMMLVLLMVVVMFVLMLMFVLIMVMVMMMMLVVRLVRDLLENLRNEVAAAFHGGEQLLAGQILPRGGDDAGVLIQAAQHGNGLVEALLRALSRAGQQDGTGMRHLILEKLTEVLEVHLGLERVNNGYKAVQLNLEVRVLYRIDNVRQLADAGRLDQDAVRMVLVHNIVQRLAEVANQRAADAACVHLVYNNAGILEEAAVNADLTELVLDQNNLFTLERIGQQTLDEGRLAGTQKTGNNINFSHALSLHFYARHRDSRTVLKFFERLYYTTFIEKRKAIWLADANLSDCAARLRAVTQQNPGPVA